MKARIKEVLVKGIGIVVAGILYGIFVIKTGLGIPCPIRLLSGLRCPGCGVSHMAIALMHGDIREAYHSNRVLFLLLPALLIIWGRSLYYYIKMGKRRRKSVDYLILNGVIIVLVGWAIVRNLPVFEYLNY